MIHMAQFSLEYLRQQRYCKCLHTQSVEFSCVEDDGFNDFLLEQNYGIRFHRFKFSLNDIRYFIK